MTTEPTAAHEDCLGDRLIRLIWWRSPNPGLAERTRRRVTVHLVPYLFFLYILAFLDRVNVSVAQLGMELPPSEGGVGFSTSVIGFGGGLFFWGYWFLEIPSTLSVVRWGARWVFVRILILWGICATLVAFIGLPFATKMFGWLPQLPDDWLGMGGVANFINELPTNAKFQFYFFRFTLGFFEGGFFPSVIVYLSLWFRQRDRAKAMALFMAAIPLSSAVGLPISGILLVVNWFGLPGWRWIFIVEGILPIIAGVATIFFLPDRPEKAKWLAADERDWLLGELDAEHHSKKGHGHWAWVHHLGTVFLLTLVYFGLTTMSYGLSMFMPAIIKSQSGVSSQMASFLATVPFVMALLAMLLNGWHSDKQGERIWHVCVPLATVGCALLLASALDSVPMAAVAVMMFIVGTCMYAHLPAFWPIPTMFLGAATAASAIGFINMLGNLGGFFGPDMVGKSVDQDIRWVSKLMENDQHQPLIGDDAKKMDELAATITSSGKLSADQSQALENLLKQVRAGEKLDQPAQEQLIQLLNRGASFSAALRKIAPWPIMSAAIILVVGLIRRRTAKPLSPVNSS